MDQPPSNHCFLCNEEIDFFTQDEFELVASFSDLLPRGAKRPSGWLWAHERCVQGAAHPSYGSVEA